MSVLLSGCASTVSQRPGVSEAKACLKHLNAAPVDFPEYKIRACTNTGVWVVEKTNLKTGVVDARYDFLNREYTGPDTGGAPLPFESLGGEQERSFYALQKKLNKALLN